MGASSSRMLGPDPAFRGKINGRGRRLGYVLHVMARDALYVYCTCEQTKLEIVVSSCCGRKMCKLCCIGYKRQG